MVAATPYMKLMWPSLWQTSVIDLGSKASAAAPCNRPVLVCHVPAVCLVGLYGWKLPVLLCLPFLMTTYQHVICTSHDSGKYNTLISKPETCFSSCILLLWFAAAIASGIVKHCYSSYLYCCGEGLVCHHGRHSTAASFAVLKH